MPDTAKQLADAEKNHNRLKKLGTTEATKEFGSYPKYIEALKETRLKLDDAKADHEDSASGEAKEPEKKPEAKKAKEPWEMTPDAPQSESPVNAPVDALVQYITGDRINRPDQFTKLYYKLSDSDRVAVAKELNKRGLLHEIDARKRKPMDANAIINSAKGQYRYRYYDSKTEYEDFLSGEAKEPEKKPEPVEEKPASKAKEPWEMTKAERGTPDANHASRGVFKTKKDAEANLAELMGKLNKSPQTKAILDQFGMDSSNTYQVVKSKKLSNRWGIAATHHHEIANAIQLGKSVPAEVLADYPDLVKKPEEKVEEKEPSEMTPEEASRKLDVLLRAPQKEAGKPRVSFATKTEEEAFRKGFQQGSKTPHGDPPLRRAGMSHPKDIKSFDAQRQGWSHGAMAGREIEKLRNDINENKTVSATAVDTYGIKLPEGYIKGGGSYVREQSAPLKPEPVEEKPKPERETGAKGKQVEAAIHKATGLPLNENGTVTVWHHTSASKAGAIRRTGLLVSDAEPDVYATTHQKPDTGYGDTAVAIGVNPEKLQLDDEFPNGRRDYSIKTGKPGGSIAVSVDKPATPPEGKPDKAAFKKTDTAYTEMQEAKREYLDLGNLSEAEGIDKFGSYDEYADALKDAESKAKKTRIAHERHIVPARTPDKVAATPPKEPVAEVKEMKEKPKPTHWRDYHEPMKEKLEKSPKKKEEPGSSWSWPPKPGDAPIEELAAQRKPEITPEITPEEAGKEQFAPLEVNPDAPKEKAEFDVTPKQHENIRDEWKKLNEINDLGKKNRQEGVQDPEVMKRYKEQKKVLDNVLTNAGLPALPKGHQDVFPNRTPPPKKYTVNGEASGLRQIGVNKSKEEKAKKAEDRMAKVEANIKAAQANRVKEDKEFAETSATNLKTDSKGTPTTNPGTGKGADLPGDQEAGGGVPPSKKELNKVQIGQIYKAKEEYDESLKNLRAVEKGDKLERKKQYDTYIGARKNLSDLRVKVGREALPRTGPINELGKHDGLDEDMIKGVEEHKKAQEEQTASRKPADQAKPAVASDPVAAEFMKGQESTPGKGPMEAGYKEWEESRPPAPAPVQRIEPTVTPPRIESIVGSKSPLPQTQPQPQAQVPAPVVPVVPAVPPAPQTQAPVPVAPAATVPAPAPQTALPAEAAPTPQPQVQPAPAGAAPVAPAPWFPLGPGKGQVTWPPQPAAGVAPAPAPSGRGSQAASQAAAASGAKPVDQGQFAPSKPQPQQQPEAPAPAPWFPFGQGNGQAPWPPQNDQAIPAPVPQPVPPAPAAAPPGKQPAPAPAPAQPLQQPVPGQPQQKPGTPQPKPPFNPFQRTEPTPAQPKPKPPFNPFQRIEDKVAPRTSRPKQQPETQPQPQQQQPGTKTQPVPVPVPVPGKPQPQQASQKQPVPSKPQQQGVPQQPMSRLEKVKKALASVGQGIGQAATNASQSVQRAATHGITKAVLAHLGVAALHGINYPKAIKNLGPKQPRKFNPGWHGFTTPVGKPEDEAKAAEQQKAAPEPKEAAEPKTSGKWERRDR